MTRLVDEAASRRMTGIRILRLGRHFHRHRIPAPDLFRHEVPVRLVLFRLLVASFFLLLGAKRIVFVCVCVYSIRKGEISFRPPRSYVVTSSSIVEIVDEYGRISMDSTIVRQGAIRKDERVLRPVRQLR